MGMFSEAAVSATVMPILEELEKQLKKATTDETREALKAVGRVVLDRGDDPTLTGDPDLDKYRPLFKK